MCGITVALAGEKEKGLVGLSSFLKDATLATQLRGTDSTGIYQVNSNLIMDFYKMPVSGSIFCDLPKANVLYNSGGSAYVTTIHNRKATTGSVAYTTAHPFMHHNDADEVDFGFVHNGTLDWWDRHKFASDSHQLAQNVFEKGTDAFTDIYGAFACVYTSLSEQITTVISNGQRDLYYCKVKDKDIILMMSEAGSLSWLASRNQIEIEENKIYKIEKGFVYSFPFATPCKFTKTAITLRGAVGTYPRNFSAVGTSTTPGIQATGKTTKERMISEMDTLHKELLGKPVLSLVSDNTKGPGPTEKALAAAVMAAGKNASTARELKGWQLSRSIPASRDSCSEEERKLFYKKVGAERTEEVITCPIYYDPTQKTLICDVVETLPSSIINKRDTVVLRDITREQSKGIMKFIEFPVVINGVEPSAFSANPDMIDGPLYYIGARPTAVEFTKAVRNSMKG